MDFDNKTAELRYQETMKAISSWVKDQNGKASREEILGISKAFLTHASMAITATIPGCDESDSRDLMKALFEAIQQFAQGKLLAKLSEERRKGDG